MKHAHGDVAYLKQGRDHIPLPAADAATLHSAFNVGEYFVPSVTDQAGVGIDLAQSPYELVVVPNIIGPDNVAFDGGVYRESAVPVTPIIDAMAQDVAFQGGTYS